MAYGITIIMAFMPYWICIEEWSYGPILKIHRDGSLAFRAAPEALFAYLSAYSISRRIDTHMSIAFNYMLIGFFIACNMLVPNASIGPTTIVAIVYNLIILRYLQLYHKHPVDDFKKDKKEQDGEKDLINATSDDIIEFLKNEIKELTNNTIYDVEL